MTDQEVELIRRHAETMACIVVEMYQKAVGFLSRSRASETQLVGVGEWIYAANHGRRGDLRSRQHEGADRESQPADTASCLRGVLPPPGLRSPRTVPRGRRERQVHGSQPASEPAQYCRLNKGRVHFVVVFNLTRFARDKYDHFALRSHLQSLGISLRSATEPIDDTSTGKLMEGVLAAFAQFDNDCRSDRTRAGMKAALELGRWVFLAPIGYLNAPRAMGKSLMPDPERAPLVRRAFEEYATGRFTKEQLLKQARAWGLTNRRGRPLTSQAIGMLVRNRLSAGIVDVTEYGVRESAVTSSR